MFLTALLLLPLTALGQQAQTDPATRAPAVDAQSYRLPVDARATLWADDSATGPSGYWQARLGLNYASNPAVFRYDDGQEVGLITDITQLDLVAAGTWEFLRVGIDLPVIAAAGSDVAGGGGGLGDVALDLKAGILDRKDAPVGLAAGARLGLPTATAPAGVSNGGASAELSAIVDQRMGDLLVAANVGALLQPGVSLGEQSFGNQAIWRLGGGYYLADDAGVSVDLAGAQGLSGSAASTPVEALVGGWARASDDIVLRGGVGRGITRGIGSPDIRLVGLVGWEPPKKRDRDGDGIANRLDDCPDTPEDADRYQDEDGCPDPANSLAITVLDHRGAIVPEARVVVLTEYGEQSGSSGMILDIHPGSYTVKINSPRFEALEKAVVVPEGQAGHEAELRLQPLFGSVMVFAVDNTRSPVLASFQVGDGAIHPTGGTSATEVDVDPGDYTVTVRANGFKSNTAPVSVQRAQTSTVRVMLQPSQAKVTAQKIEIADKVYFDTGKATIKAMSHPLLDDVAAVLLEYPRIRKLRVEGHTDSRGSASRNKRLSQARAEAVRDYLVNAGVGSKRLEAMGFGEEQPVDPANRSEAWAKNRRVEFVIVDQGETGG